MWKPWECDLAVLTQMEAIKGKRNLKAIKSEEVIILFLWVDLI